MKRFICALLMAGVLGLMALPTSAQNMTPAMTAPAAMPAAPAMAKPVAQPMAPATAPAMAAPAMPAPAAMPAAPAAMPAAPAMATTPAMAPAPTMEAPPAMAAAPKADKPKVSADDKAAKWITILTPIILAIISLLSGMGYMNWTKKERAKKVSGIADKVINGLEPLAAGTAWKWDDAVLAAIKAINVRMFNESDLSSDEEKAVKKIMETRRPEIEAKLKAANGNGEKTEDKPKDDEKASG